MDEHFSSSKITSNFLWRLFERFGAQGVTLIVTIVLARLLEPTAYGTVALITVFTTLFQVFVDCGFGIALVQKKNSDDIDFSTVFWFNILMCLSLYIVLFFSAPLIANFYENYDLTLLIRVSGLTLIVSGIKSIQNAYVSKHLLFKKFFFATIAGTISAAFIGVWMAYQGFGVWSLIMQSLCNLFIDTTILWIIVKWKPKFVFSFKRFKQLFSFGWKLLIASLINTGYNELRSLIIGKRYTAEDLAYYNKGSQFPKMIATNINTSIDNTLLPAMSNKQDDKERLKAMTRRAIKTSSFVLWPCMIGLAACSPSLISLLLTNKWVGAIPYLIIFCITYGFYPINTANLNAIKALGRSDLTLLLEVIKKSIGVAVILVFMNFGVLWLAISVIITSIISQIVNSWPNKKLLGYSYIQQLCDILPSLVLSIFMGFCVFCVNLIDCSNIIKLLIQILLGMIIYIGIAWAFKYESLSYCLNIIKQLFFKRYSRP